MSDIKISVVVPVYNVAKYLAKCMDCIVNQTFKDIEIICINDGSTDNSLEILEKYAKNDSRIKIVTKKNEGLSAARNDGMKLAKGEYVSFIDSDDWIDLNFFEYLYNAVKKYDCDIACSNIIRASGEKRRKIIRYDIQEYTNDADKKNDLARVPIYNYVWNKIYKREKLLKYNLEFPVGRVFEDLCWSIKAVYYLDGVVSVPGTAYYYRKNPNSLVAKKSEKNVKDCAQSEQEMLEFAEEKHLKILNGYRYAKRERIRFLGITFIKIFHYYPDIKEYCIFGVIPVYRGKTKTKKWDLYTTLHQTNP